jgi:hypothetical protein
VLGEARARRLSNRFFDKRTELNVNCIPQNSQEKIILFTKSFFPSLSFHCKRG